jgi:hypothetical protein
LPPSVIFVASASTRNPKGQSPDRANATRRKNNFAESQRRGLLMVAGGFRPQGFIN